MLKAIKIRIYPDAIQANYINRQLGCCRFLYNHILAWRNELYEETKSAPTSLQENEFIKNLKNEYPFLKEVHSKALQQSIRDLNTAYSNFFKSLKKGTHVGFPKFKSKKTYNEAYRLPVDAFIGVNGNRISFVKALKDIHFKCSQRDEKLLNKYQSKVKSSSIRRNSCNQYYASILIELPCDAKHAPTDNVVGIDLGLKYMVITSEGEVFNKLTFGKLKAKQKKYQRQLNKTDKDSRRHHKIRIKLAKVHQKMKNQREWYHHHVANSILNENQVICMEDLNISGMMQNHKLAQAFQDQGLYNFFTILKYKALWQGKEIIQVGRFYPSSKLCHACGYKMKSMPLDVREWICPECGEMHDRDINAAKNILEEGLRIYKEKIGLSSPEFTHVDYPTMDDKEIFPLKSSGRMNREKNVISSKYMK